MKAISILLFLFAQTYALQSGVNVIYTGLTQEEKRNIVHIHNKFRAKIANGKIPTQPPAENMREMQWDEELARIAQDWASNAEYKHNRDRHVGRFFVGENIAEVRSSAPQEIGDFTDRIVSLWFNEYKSYKYGQGMSPKIGHYTQWVWAETSMIGCGFSDYYDRKDSRYHKYYVCNYGEAGNVLGEMPYAAGKPSCTQHGMKFSHKYPGLCNNWLVTNNKVTYEILKKKKKKKKKKKNKKLKKKNKKKKNPVQKRGCWLYTQKKNKNKKKKKKKILKKKKI
jgi:hypothetical protein